MLSNVSSNCLPKKMHSFIGCIYSIFPHCVFSNVSSKHLHERMHLCIYASIVTLVALVWLFPTVSFQMFPQIAFIRGCIVTLVAFVWLFSPVRLLKSPPREVATQALKVHNITGEKPHQRKQCHFSSIQAKSLKKHKRIHSWKPTKLNIWQYVKLSSWTQILMQGVC